MRALIALGCFLLSATSLHAQTPSHYWSKHYGGTSADQGFTVDVDEAGNVFLVGSLIGTGSFGGASMTSAGGADIVLAKYNSNGVHRWSKRFGSTGTDLPAAVAVDHEGNVFLGGEFNGTVDFGGDPLTSAGVGDMIVAKFNTDGVHLWSQRFGGADPDRVREIVVDGSDNIYFTGSFTTGVDFGGGLLTGNGLQAFLAKFDPDGTHIWSAGYGGTLTQIGNDLVLDSAGNVIFTGVFEFTIDLGGGTFTNFGLLDVFLAKYNSNGVHQWSRQFGGTASDNGNAVTIDGSGNVALAGNFNGTASFGGTALVSAGLSDIFLAKYDASGIHQWSQRFGGTDNDTANEIGTNGVDLFITGNFLNTVDFGGGGLVSAGSGDVFVAKYRTDGVHVWSDNFGGASNDLGHALDVDDSGDLLLAGAYNATIDFGGGPLPSFGSVDAYLVKFGDYTPAFPNIHAITDVPNDQGRLVSLTFANSGLDNPGSPTPIVQYEAFFRDDPLSSAALPLVASEHLRISNAAPTNWVFVGAVPAHGDHIYSMFAPTTADSAIVSGQHHSAYFVRAATANPFLYFDSQIDSGYSVDNLAPSVPTGFALNTGDLTWDESSATDFDYFSVYGSASSTFDATATLIDHTVGTTLDVSADPHTFYYLTATDFSGNEGGAARINTLTGVAPSSRNLMAINAYPNPFNPGTTVRYDLPASGRVVVSIYDARGALVITLVDEEKDAGSYPVQWNGVDARGNRAGSGVYFARLAFAGQTTARKLVLIK